jgi:hypothetical protein
VLNLWLQVVPSISTKLLIHTLLFNLYLILNCVHVFVPTGSFRLNRRITRRDTIGHRVIWPSHLLLSFVQIFEECLFKHPVRCQGPNGPGGPLGLGLEIRLNPYLGVK